MAQYARLPGCLRCKGLVEPVPATLPPPEAPEPSADACASLPALTVLESLLPIAPENLDGSVTLAQLLRCLPVLPTVKECTAALVDEALRRERGTPRAARALGIGKTTLYRRLHSAAGTEARA